MSLINQMLQDLEKRRASSVELGALPNQVRVLPRAEKSSVPWWLLGSAAVLAVIALLAWQLSYQSAPVVATVAPPQPPASATAEVPPPPPALRLAPALEKTRPPAAAKTGLPRAEPKIAVSKEPAAPSAAAKAPPATLAIRQPLATSSVVSASAAEKPALVASAAEAPKVAAAKADTATGPRTPTIPAITLKPVGAVPRVVEVLPDITAQTEPANPQIDKHTQQLTPQQLAENEYHDAANLLNQGRLAEAEQGFRRALQDFPEHTGARQGLVGLLMDAKKNGEAEQVLKEGLAVNPNQTNFAILLANLQYERGDIAGAIETMQKTEPAALSSPDYLARLAALLQRQSRQQEAVDHYQAALRLAPGSGVWWMGLGISLQALNRNSEAQDAFQRAKATNTLNADLQAFVDQRLRQLQ